MWNVVQSPTDAEMFAVQGVYLVADKLPIEDAKLIAVAPVMLDLLRQELENVRDDLRWADGGEMERLMLRRDNMQAVITAARAS